MRFLTLTSIVYPIIYASQRADRLAVWLKQSSNMKAVLSVGCLSSPRLTKPGGFFFHNSFQVGKLVKERLQLEAGTKQVR